MTEKNYLTFRDALKSKAPSAFTSVVRHYGSSCNLNCTYCCDHDKDLKNKLAWHRLTV